MRQYNRELRDRVAEISRGDSPMDLVLLTVVEMTVCLLIRLQME